MNSTAKHPISRWSAAFRHLLASLLCVSLCFGSLFWLWYSPGLWTLSGISPALWALLAGVTLAGPLMTLAAFRHDKPGIRTDMAVIVAIQIAFFAYAVFAIGRIRPVYLVTAVDRFEMVRAAELAPADLAAARPEYRQLSWTGPKQVGIKLPEDSNERYKLIMSGLAGKDVHLMPQLYTDYKDSAQDLVRHALQLPTLSRRSARNKASIDNTLARKDRSEADTRFVPIRGANYAAAIMLIDATTGTPIRALGINPWEDETSVATATTGK